MSRKQCGKRRKCWLPAFSPFPTMFSETVFFRLVKSQDLVVKSLATFDLSPAKALDSDEYKIWLSGDVLKAKPPVASMAVD